jgi:alpha-beta hydrolase superfamily lysophospholipase
MARVRPRSSAFLALLFSALCCAAPQHATAPPAVVDADEIKCHDLMAALVADSAESAEKDFDATMRAKFPPSMLRSTWHAFEARYGALSTWRVAKRDHPYGKDRFTLEATFGQQIMVVLVAFEPASGQVIGMFFSTGSAQKAPSQEDADPSAREIPVSVGPLGLGGSLMLPTATGSHPMPCALLIAGSGPNNRDEALANLKPLKDLALGLAKRGIVTLRYDKRTFTHPELFQHGKDTSVDDEVVSDAIAALALLRTRPEVDPDRVFVIGHSLGALLAPEIAQRGGGVAGLVLLAAPGRPAEQILLEQLRDAGANAADLATLEAQVRDLPKLAANDLVWEVPAGYWRDLDRRDEMAIALELAKPVLLLRGALDRNVAAIDQDHWLTRLSGRVPVEAVTLPGLDHLFVPPGAETTAKTHISDEVIRRIATFIENAGGAH